MSFLNDTAELWWRWMLPMSIQVSFLVLVVALLDSALARWAWPEMRAALWLLILVKLVVPPTVSSPVSLAHAWPESVVHATDASALSTTAAVALFVVWLLGTAFFAGLALARYRRLRHAILMRATPAPRWLASIAARAGTRLSLARVPVVLSSPGVAGPAVLGFRRPVVVLPSAVLESGSRVRIEHVLLHELAHVKRRDPLTSLAILLLQILYWFHPLIWFTRRRIATLREICCDQVATGALDGRRDEYRHTLLRLARPLFEGPTVGELGFVQRHSQLLARLEWLEQPIRDRPRMRRIATSLCTLALMLCCVPLAPRIATPSFLATLPPIEELEGCLQLRYAVFANRAAARNEAEARSSASPVHRPTH